jgi:hypothetical protein
MGIAEVRSIERYPVQIDSAQVRPAQDRAFKVHTAAEVRRAELGPAQIRSGEVRHSEIEEKLIALLS